MPDPMKSFWGEHEASLDDRGRILFPQEFRNLLADEFVLTRGPDRALLLFPTAVWAEIEAKLDSAVLQRETGFLQRMFGGRAIVKLDPQGRLVLPKHLREWAGFDDVHVAVVVGQGPKLEIWSKANWRTYNGAFTYERMFDAAELVGIAKAIER
ncbi:MAG TPA: hypothetical protein VLH79_00195 [Chthonomonadales bacterium]|nr:hypothetical protein [Chthonomonadales bacterium]